MHNSSETNILNELTMLYELSMAAGTHIDLKQNCDTFAATLKSRKNLTSVSIWLYSQHLYKNESQKLELVTGNPEILFDQKHIEINNPVINELSDKAYTVISSNQSWFKNENKQEKEGYLAIFKLNNIGIICLFSCRKESPFTDTFMRKMIGVIYKMAVTIEGSLAHQKNLQEIKQRKIIEEQLSKLNESLEQQVSDRTQELQKTQATMVHQEKMASIGQLAAGVAHELNNPIGFISSNFEVLQRYMESIDNYISEIQSCIESKADQYSFIIEEVDTLRKKLKIDYVLQDVESIFSESDEGFKRIISIINNLRSFSRIDSDKEIEASDLNECINNTLVVANNEVKYVARVEKDLQRLPLISCNAGEINQVLLNLLVNAAQEIKETSSGQEGVINIKTWHDNKYIFCSIEDNGPGIAHENIDQLFNPFFTTKAPGIGTGLGLHISYDIIVNKHKGKIYAENTDSGAKFTMVLPNKLIEG